MKLAGSTSRLSLIVTTTTALVATLATTSASAIVITFSDSVFNSANYTPTSSYESDAFVFGDYTFVGGALSVLHARPGEASWSAAQGFINNTFVYNPLAQGTVTSIDASVDKALLLLIGDLNGYTGTFGNSFRPLISQGGLYYVARIGPPLPGDSGGDAYANFVSSTISQSGLVAANFEQFNFSTGLLDITNHPNFSGTEMRFGLAQLSSTVPLVWENTLIAASYDNLRLNLNTVPVPEPTTLSLLGAALLVGGFVHRRRARAH